MFKCKCPYCNQKAIPYRTKFFLQPHPLRNKIRTTECDHCKNPVSVPIWTSIFKYFFYLVLLFAISGLLALYFSYLGIAIAAGCYVLYTILNLLLVPLVKWHK